MAVSYGFTPGDLDIFFKRGEDLRCIIQLSGPGPGNVPPRGVPINFTGCSFRMQIRKKSGGPVLADLTVAPCSLSAMVIDPTPADGRLLLFIPRSITADIPTGDYAYDLWILDSQNLDHPYFTGAVTVTPNITSPTF